VSDNETGKRERPGFQALEAKIAAMSDTVRRGIESTLLMVPSKLGKPQSTYFDLGVRRL
jgi:hypothetical protein